jgi:outer membrane protein assembly factor BamD (BamD/ComL family)
MGASSRVREQEEEEKTTTYNAQHITSTVYIDYDEECTKLCIAFSDKFLKRNGNSF